MKTRTLELEIKGTWWMWRGCLQDYFLGYDTETFCANPVQGIDPMDRYDHKEASAFPMQKPNFDIFGIPQRTRSQRGWYQVQPHPKARSKLISVLSTPPSSSDAPATGADLPIELVKLVGQMMSEVLEWSRDDDRRTMMACALVCRYWANQFSYKMFRLTPIDSRQRALGLLGFGRSSACWYRRFVQPEVYMTMKSFGELPFMHLLPCHTYKHAWLRGPLPRSWKTMRSVHWGLPRPVPRSFSSGIISLALTDIHFQRFSDLVDLVCELPDVRHLHCTKVTWGPLPDTITTARLPRRRRTHKDTLQITTDSDMWVQAGAHLFTCYLSRHGHSFFPTDVVLALVSIVDHIFRISNMADGLKSDIIPRYVWYRSEDRCFSLRWRSSVVTVSAVQKQALLSTGPIGEVTVLHVTAVTVNLGHLPDFQSVEWKASDWLQFDKQIPLLKPTRLVFAFRSRNHMLTFGEHIVDALMPRASAHGSIRYALRDKWDMWYKASRESDILQGPPVLLLDDLYKD